MFDRLRREMKRMAKPVRIPIEIPLDDHGHMDRLCPSSECNAEFKVCFEDWRDKVRDKQVFCPICRCEAVSTEWNTPAQAEHIKQVSLAHVHKVINRAMAQDARDFSVHAGFITMRMSHEPGRRPIVIPLETSETLQQHFTCETCHCRYSSIGAAFFCPACGHNSAATIFMGAVTNVRNQVAILDRIKQTVNDALGADAATDTGRQILENGLVKLVASFQRFAEATFTTLPLASSIKVRKNLFQTLGEASDVWRNAAGKGYEDILTPVELEHLVVFFQQRHLLSHREGIVDQDYIDKSKDTSFTVGQKLVIKEAAVLRLADLIERLGNGVKGLCPPS